MMMYHASVDNTLRKIVLSRSHYALGPLFATIVFKLVDLNYKYGLCIMLVKRFSYKYGLCTILDKGLQTGIGSKLIVLACARECGRCYSTLSFKFVVQMMMRSLCWVIWLLLMIDLPGGNERRGIRVQMI